MTFIDRSRRNWLKALWHDRTTGRRAPAGGRHITISLRELHALPDHHLADIGLCRSDLTPEGLEIAGAKRRAKQRALATEIARRAAKTAGAAHGD